MGNLSINASDGTTLVRDVEWAGTFLRRCAGLLGRNMLGPDRGMLLIPCRAVHTCFMRFSLDIMFLSRDYRVVRAARNIGPWNFVYGGRRSWCVLEMQAGWFPWDRLRAGDRVILAGKAR